MSAPEPLVTPEELHWLLGWPLPGTPAQAPHEPPGPAAQVALATAAGLAMALPLTGLRARAG